MERQQLQKSGRRSDRKIRIQPANIQAAGEPVQNETHRQPAQMTAFETIMMTLKVLGIVALVAGAIWLFDRLK